MKSSPPQKGEVADAGTPDLLVLGQALNVCICNVSKTKAAVSGQHTAASIARNKKARES